MYRVIGPGVITRQAPFMSPPFFAGREELMDRWLAVRGEDSVSLSDCEALCMECTSRCGFEGEKVALHGVCVIHPHP